MNFSSKNKHKINVVKDVDDFYKWIKIASKYNRNRNCNLNKNNLLLLSQYNNLFKKTKRLVIAYINSVDAYSEPNIVIVFLYGNNTYMLNDYQNSLVYTGSIDAYHKDDISFTYEEARAKNLKRLINRFKSMADMAGLNDTLYNDLITNTI